MAASSGNQALSMAKKAKQDEFYTQLGDISNELRYYKAQLRDKTILCNCDDPFESNFFKYFALNFNTLDIKKLIATSYAKSPIVGGQLPLFDIEGLKPEGREPYAVEINEVPDHNSDGAIDITDVEYLLKHDNNTARPLKDNGDFRSQECVEFLKEADVVITNPPFSLFREYVAQLVAHDKLFLIIGSKNAVTYKEIFQFIMENKLWLGYGFAAGNAYFKIPLENIRDYADGVYDKETGLVKFRNVGWFTNMDNPKRHEEITLYKKYNPAEYPQYDNYDAIEVSKTAEIPVDYDGAMGVPITFLDKYNPEQFEIIGIDRYTEGNKTPGKRMTINGKEIYARILIKRKGASQ
ncbi:MAG: adenine-specific methyltransferase EcoRI family protein [Holophagales bacterium]|jgi:hypothetical protein|nr:adenine-specific methyltransferase EcoRI family protein [Holophagales bacterium]